MSDAESTAWAYAQFSDTPIRDIRNRRRLVSIAAQMARVNGGRLCEVFADARERDAAYDFVENRRIDAKQILSGAAIATARSLAQEPFVWLVVDGTSLSLPDSRKTKGMGRIGSGDNKGTGIKVITCLAVDRNGVPAGPGQFSWWARTKRKNKLPGGKCRVCNGKRPVSDKETQRWLDTIEDTRSIWMQRASRVHRWWVMDREGDSISHLHAVARCGDTFTIRSNVNRNLVRARSSGFGSVRSALAAQRVADEFELRVPNGKKRLARRAHMHVSTARITLDMRENWSKKKRPLEVNAVWVREVGTTPPGEKPIEWILHTNHSLDAIEDLQLVLYSYMQRWRIEDFHRTWKSGACRVESTRLASVHNVTVWASIGATIAVRTERLKLLSRTQPDAPAEQELSEYEVRVIRAVKRKEGRRVPKVLSLEQAVIFIAEIGGYTGKSSGGPPGSTTIARGLERVALLAEGMKLAEQLRADQASDPKPSRNPR